MAGFPRGHKVLYSLDPVDPVVSVVALFSSQPNGNGFGAKGKEKGCLLILFDFKTLLLSSIVTSEASQPINGQRLLILLRQASVLLFGSAMQIGSLDRSHFTSMMQLMPES